MDESPFGPQQEVNALRTQLAEQRRQARSRNLARIAASQVEVDPECALLLALEANSVAVSYESRDVLQQAMSASRLRWILAQKGEARIQHAYFAQDSRHVITASDDGVLRWWDPQTQTEVGALHCCAGPIDGFHLSPLRQRALLTTRASESEKFQRIVIDLLGRKTLAAVDDDNFAHDDAAALTVFFSEDGRLLLLSKGDGSWLSLCESASGARIFEAKDAGCCHGLDHAGRRALVTRPDGSVVVIQLEGTGRTTLMAVPNEGTTPACYSNERNAGPQPFSSDGGRVTLGTSDRVAYVWDACGGRLLHILGEECPCHRSLASFTPSGRWIVVQQYDSVTAEIWDAHAGKLQCRLPQSSAFHVPLRFLPVEVRPEAAEYAVVGMGAANYSSWPLPVNLVREWDITSGAIRSQFRLPGTQTFVRSFGTEGPAVHSAVKSEHDDISPDTNWVLRLEDGVVRGFVRNETSEAPERPPEHSSSFTADRRIGWGPGGQTLVDSLTNRELATLGKHERYLFSLNGRYLVGLAHRDTKPIVQVWDGRTGEPRFAINHFSDAITTLQFQPLRDRLLIGSRDHAMRLWSLETGTVVACAYFDAPDDPSCEAASSTDGMKVAFATSGRMHVWHVDRGEIVHAPTMLYARDPRFSADGSWLLAADEDVARIWDTDTMSPVSAFSWHFATVMSGDISPDKKLAASCGVDNRVRLWEAATWQEITQWHFSNEFNRNPLRFSSDGAHLDCPDGQRLIVDVEQLVSLARTRVFRALSPPERWLFLREREG